jgi:hypothetical protein
MTFEWSTSTIDNLPFGKRRTPDGKWIYHVRLEYDAFGSDDRPYKLTATFSASNGVKLGSNTLYGVDTEDIAALDWIAAGPAMDARQEGEEKAREIANLVAQRRAG